MSCVPQHWLLHSNSVKRARALFPARVLSSLAPSHKPRPPAFSFPLPPPGPSASSHTWPPAPSRAPCCSSLPTQPTSRAGGGGRRAAWAAARLACKACKPCFASVASDFSHPAGAVLPRLLSGTHQPPKHVLPHLCPSCPQADRRARQRQVQLALRHSRGHCLGALITALPIAALRHACEPARAPPPAACRSMCCCCCGAAAAPQAGTLSAFWWELCGAVRMRRVLTGPAHARICGQWWDTAAAQTSHCDDHLTHRTNACFRTPPSLPPGTARGPAVCGGAPAQALQRGVHLLLAWCAYAVLWA